MGDISVIFKVSYMWYAAVGCLTVIIVGLLVSLVTGGANDIEMIDPRLFSPVLHKLKRFLPGGNRVRDCNLVEVKQ